MKDKEGLVIQGCGGDLEEWEKGINDILTDQNILRGLFQTSFFFGLLREIIGRVPFLYGFS